jgi:hypothetical protein
MPRCSRALLEVTGPGVDVDVVVLDLHENPRIIVHNSLQIHVFVVKEKPIKRSLPGRAFFPKSKAPISTQ